MGTPMHPKPGWLNYLWFAALPVMFGAGWLLAGKGGGHDDRLALPDAPEGGQEPQVVQVTVAPVAVRPVQRSVDAVGTLHGYEEVVLSAKTEGRIRAIRRDVSDRVAPGELIMEIDPTDSELAVRQAERAVEVELAKLGLKEMPREGFTVAKVPTVVQAQARLESAQSKHQRLRRLVTTRAASAEDLDNATSDVRVAEAELRQQAMMAEAGLATAQLRQVALSIAKQQRQDAEVRAPVPTRPVAGDAAPYAITQRAVSEGTFVRVGTEVCRLVIDRTLKLRLPVPERHAAEVRLGQAVEVAAMAHPGSLRGTVARVNPAIDPATRAFEVEVEVPNHKAVLKPGGFAKAAILTRLDAGAATVPLAAIVRFAGITKIFLVKDGRAAEVQVTLGLQRGDWVEIASPSLPPGAVVITSGQTVLADGSPVSIRATKGGGK